MKLEIATDITFEQLKEQFSKVYPFLRIEFYKKKHAAGMATLERYRHEQKGRVLALLNGSGKSHAVDISGNRTVSQFESDIQELLGIGVQVFRKSGSLWIETTLTDNWTLLQQNHEGRLMSVPLGDEEKPDYHEQD